MAVYVVKGKKIFKMENAMRIFCKDISSVISENEFYFCYGMSKMTVARESQNHSSYFNVHVTEFLELIGRIAELKYRETSGLGLHEKIEFLLDMVFELIEFTRVPVNINIEEESVSDDEY